MFLLLTNKTWWSSSIPDLVKDIYIRNHPANTRRKSKNHRLTADLHWIRTSHRPSVLVDPGRSIQPQSLYALTGSCCRTSEFCRWGFIFSQFFSQDLQNKFLPCPVISFFCGSLYLFFQPFWDCQFYDTHFTHRYLPVLVSVAS